MPDHRRRQALRIIGALLLLLIALFATHAVWGRVAQARLRRDVQALRQAGEPMLPEDFAQSAIPDSDNAAVELRAAGAAIIEDDLQFAALQELRAESPLTARESEIIKTALDAFSTALTHVDAAVTKPGLNWNLTIKTPVLTLLLPHLKGQRAVAALLAADLLYAHQQGDDARALRRATQIRFISQAVDRSPLMVSHLVSIGCSYLASTRLLQIAPDLKVGGDGGVKPDQLSAAIQALLTKDSEDTGLLYSLRSERMMDLDAFSTVVDGTMGFESSTPKGKDGLQVYALKPLLAEDARFAVRHMTGIIDRMGKSPPANWPTCRAAQPAMPADFDKATIRHMLSRMLLPATSRFFQQHYRGLTVNRLAATALAIRWYCVEHDGKFPSQLADLVPQYLPAVPADPMAAARSLGYLEHGSMGASTGPGTGPILYSVGDNGTDDGGSEQPMMPNRHEDPWDFLDVVVHLTPQPRKPRPDEDSPVQTPATAPPTRPAE